jgi:hypothetical protein
MLRSCGRIAEDDLRVVRVKDTLSLGEALVSDAVLRELQSASGIEVIGGHTVAFDAAGALTPL